MLGNDGVCNECGKRGWLVPLHGEKGGPLKCIGA